MALLAFALVVSACTSGDTDTVASTTGEAVAEVADPADATQGDPNSQPQPIEPPATKYAVTSAFEPSECFTDPPPGFPGGDSLTCGYVTVPLDHAEPDADTIRLATVFVDNGSDHPPVVFLPGGPGGSGATAAPTFFGAPFDLIAFDERGVGFSEPSLDCHEANDLFEYIVATPVRATLEPYRAALQACRTRLVDTGIDFELFDSAQSARDIGAVQRAWGFDEATILAGSYGTRLALTKMRDEPEGIRGVILDSVVPIDANVNEFSGANYKRAFDLLVTQCAASPECHAMGDVATNAEELAQMLDESPVIVTAERPFGGGQMDLLVDGDQLSLMIFDSLYNARSFEQLPRILAQALGGEPDALLPLAESTLFVLDPVLNASEGYRLSVTCREEWPFNDPAKVTADAAIAPPIVAAAFDVEQDCAMWDTVPAPAIENEPVTSSIPALVFAGSFDPVTPPSDSERVAERLSNAVYIEIPGGGHGVAPTTPCGVSLVEAFVADPTSPLDLSCVDELTGPNWQTDSQN